MWRILLPLLSTLVAVAASAAGPGVFLVGDGSAEPGFTLEALAASAEEVVFAMTVAGIRHEVADTPEGDFARLSLPGAGRWPRIGAADLPVVRRWVEITPGARIEVQVTDLDTSRVLLADLGLPPRIVPVQEPVPKVPGAEAARRFACDPAYYAGAAWDPPEIVRVEMTGTMRGRELALVAFHPLRYRPVAGEIEIVRRATIRLRLVGGDRALREERRRRYDDPRAVAMLTHLVLSPDVPAEPTPAAGPAGYVVIAPERFAAAPEVLDLAAWKTTTGHDVTILSTAVTGSSADQIRAVIQEAYAAWDVPPLYVLLVGDTADVGYFVGRADDRPATDLYFSTVDGGDDLPDLWVGRLPVTTPEELSAAVAKLLSFEKAEWTAGDAWEKHAAFIASEDRSYITEATHEHVIASYLAPRGYAVDRLYADTYHATGPQVFAAIQAGLSLAIYSGHGDVTFWVDPYFDEQSIAELHNPVFPVVQSFACLTGSYDYDRAFAEAWLREPWGGVAFLGASSWSYWDEDDLLERAIFEGFFDNPDPGGAPDLTWLSGMIDYGKLRFLAEYGPSDESRLYFEMYNLMGDPALDVWTDAPLVIAPAHETVLPFGATTVAVQVPGIAGARVGLSSAGRCLGAGLTDAAGSAVVTLREPLVKGAVVTLAVTGHDLRPYIAQIPVSTGSFSLDDFTATGGDARVDVAWSASGEEEVRGYLLERGDAEAGPFVALGDEIAAGSGDYTFADEGLPPATTFWYRLRVLFRDGGTQDHGPIPATTSDEPPPDVDADHEDDGGCGC